MPWDSYAAGLFGYIDKVKTGKPNFGYIDKRKPGGIDWERRFEFIDKLITGRLTCADAGLYSDADGHVWLPHSTDQGVEQCWRCGCLKLHVMLGHISYRAGFFFTKDRPPSPCRKHRRSNCPI